MAQEQSAKRNDLQVSPVFCMSAYSWPGDVTGFVDVSDWRKSVSLFLVQPIIALLAISQNILVLQLAGHGPVHPAYLLCQVCVDTRHILLATAYPPRYYSNLSIVFWIIFLRTD